MAECWRRVTGERGPEARHDKPRSADPRPLPNLGQRRGWTCLAATQATHSGPEHLPLIIWPRQILDLIEDKVTDDLHVFAKEM